MTEDTSASRAIPAREAFLYQNLAQNKNSGIVHKGDFAHMGVHINSFVLDLSRV